MAVQDRIEPMPKGFELTILDGDGESQGEWVCHLDAVLYWSECGEYRVEYSDDEKCWLYLGGMFHDQYLRAAGEPGHLPRRGWVGCEGGPAEGYSGRLRVMGEEEADAVADAAADGDVSWLLGGGDDGAGGGAGRSAPPPKPLLPPMPAPECGHMCQLRQARCCAGMDSRPVLAGGARGTGGTGRDGNDSTGGGGYESYIDGVGYCMTATRHEGYCPECRERIEHGEQEACGAFVPTVMAAAGPCA
eukprot:g1755.t1